MINRNILAIEAAVGGGSIALLSAGLLIDKWHSPEITSRSEQLLGIIGSLVDKSFGGKDAISAIAVSRGPGSYTGIRIGLATAIGLGRALDIPVVGISVLRAMAIQDNKINRLVVVPIGRSGFCWQYFAAGVNDNEEPIGNGSIDNLIQQLDDSRDLRVIAQGDAYDHIHSDGRLSSGELVLSNFGRDVAVAVGLAAPLIDEGLEPLYARDPLISPTITP